MEKANEIAKRLNIADFGGSNGWLDRFRKRHGIVYRKICGEADAVDDNSIKSWKETILPNLLKDYSPEDIYNADEFGLFFKLMSNKSLVMKDETCHGGKLSKDRLTVLTCSNWSGTDKLKLLLNCEFVKQKRNVLLFVDNCPAHPKEITLTNIKLVFFPPNATSKLQPLDQGVIKVLKQKYRKKLVQRYLLEMESVTDEEIPKIPKINVLDAIHYVSIAWDEIKPEVIKNCFNKAYFGNVSQEDPHVLDSDEFRDFEEVYPGYTSIDDQLITNEALELEEIINQATVNDEPDEPSDDEEKYIPPLPSIASTVQSISTLRQALTATDGSENMLLYLENGTNRIWLTFDESSKKLFCSVCLAFALEQKTFTKGMSDWKHIHQWFPTQQ
ncbi:tigger transposable element-derived protein 4-like [Aphis gossypii]|uniref:tigger transposable element-derived protein 4-like n=1 Tax=Aphis gossypii TaxID=80765 RepID=UPI00215979EF|nr:tigger transposable element-derived protein 4-like [Aphis gossypii]